MGFIKKTRAIIITSVLLCAIWAVLTVVLLLHGNVPNENGEEAYYYDGEIAIVINGQPVDFLGGQGPTHVDGVILVPVRAVFVMLGFDMNWSDGDRITVLRNAGYEVRIAAGSDEMTVNDVPHPLDIPARHMDNYRKMVPLRSVLAAVGISMEWGGNTGTVTIECDSVPEPVRASRAGAWRTISVIGDERFTERTQRALELIETESPRYFALVLRYISSIHQSDISGIVVSLSRPIFLVCNATSSASTTSYASSIVHDAVHAIQYDHHYMRYHRVPSGVYSGMEAEMEALDIQIAFLKEINAPQHEINSYINKRGTAWW
jgi:hypothetical protein